MSELGEGPYETSAHAHPVAFTSRGGWSCDGARSVSGGCGGGGLGGARRFRCTTGCDFDLCDKCVAASKSAAASSSGESSDEPGDDEVAFSKLHAHGLKFCAQGGWSCDGCRGRPDCRRYKCAQGCNYDLCAACLKQSRLAADDPAVVQRQIDAAADFFRSKLSYAKSQPVSWMERVTEAYQQVRARIAELRADAATAGSAAVQELCATTEAAMAAHEDDLESQVAARKLDDDKGFVQRRQDYARQNGLRFMERVEEAHREVRERLDAMEKSVHYRRLDAGLQEYVDGVRQALLAYERQLAAEKQRAALDNDMDWVRRRHQEIVGNHMPRFPDRARDTCRDVLQRLAAMAGCEAFYGLAEVDAFLAEYEGKARTLLAEAEAVLLTDEIDRAVHSPNHFVQMAVDTLERMGSYGGQALGHFDTAEQYWAKLEFEHEAWLQQPVFLQAKAKYEAKCQAFRAKHDAVVLNEEAKQAVETARQLLSFVDSYRVGHFARALDYLRESRDKADEIRANARLARLASVQDFLLEHEAALRAKQASLDEELLAKEVREATDKALQLLGFVGNYFDMGQDERALDYLQQSKDACEAVTGEARFVGRPELEPFLQKYADGRRAFEQRYRDTVLARALAEATDKANTLLSHAFTYDDSGRHGQALDYLRQARDAHAAALVDGRLQELRDQLQAFDAQFRQRAEEFDARWAARTYAEQRAELMEAVTRPLQLARMHLDSHRHGQALEELRRAQQAADELRGDARYAADEQAQACLAAGDAGVADFRADFEQRALTADYRAQTDTAAQLLRNASSYFDSGHRAQALDYLQQARRAAAAVAGSTAFAAAASLQQALGEFRARFAADAAAFAQRYDDAVLDDDVNGAVDGARQLLRNASSYFDSHHDGQALDYYRQAKQQRDELLSPVAHADWLAKRGDVLAQFRAQFDADAADFLRRYAERQLADELAAAEAAVNDNVSHAFSYFESHRSGQALDYYRAAEAAVAALAVNDKLAAVPRVVQLLDSAGRRLADFRAAFAAREYAERLRAARDAAASNVSHAASYFQSHRRAQSLDYLAQARAALLAYRADSQLMADESTPTWLAEVEHAVAAFEQQFADAVYAEQLAEAIGACRQQLQFAEQSVATDVPRALASLQQARSLAAELGADARFIDNAQVQQFLADEFAAKLQQQQRAVDAQLAAQRLHTAHSDCTTALNSAKIYFASQHRGQAFELLQRARDQLDLFAAEHRTDDAAKQFVDSFGGQLADAERQFAAALFDEELAGHVSAAESLLADAERQFAARRRDVALEQFERAKDAALRLSEPRYFGVPQVEQFFAAWRQRTEAFRAAFNSAAFAEQVAAAVDQAESRLSNARALFEQGLHDACAEQLREARRELRDIAANPSFAGVARVADFVARFTGQLTDFAAAANEQLHGQAVARQVAAVREQLAVAETLYSQHAHTAAVERYNQARDQLAALRNSGADVLQHSLVVAFLPDADQQLAAFGRRFAAEQLAAQARDAVAPLQADLHAAEVLASRALWHSDALKDGVRQLAAALAALAAQQPLLSQHDDVKQLAARVADLRTRYAAAVLAPTARTAVAEALRQLDGHVARYLDRGQLDQAVQAFDERVRKPTAFLWAAPDADLHAALPDVQAFFDRVADYCRTKLDSRTTLILADGQTAASTQADSSSSSSSSGPRSLLDVLGGTLEPPSSDYLRLANIPLTVDISPNAYTDIKAANAIASRVFTSTRELGRALQQMPFGKAAAPGGSEVNPRALQIFSRDTAGYPIEAIEQCIKDYRRHVESAVKGAGDDAAVQSLASGFATFEQRWAEMNALWRRASAMGQQFGQLLMVVDYLATALAKGKECLGVNSNPNQLHLTHPVTVMTKPGDVGNDLPMQSTDYEVFLLVVDRCRQYRELVDRLEASWGGFPNKDRFVASLDALAAEARKLHPQHCIYVVMHLAGNKSDCRRLYVQALRRFPIARRVLNERLRAAFFKNHARRLPDMKQHDADAYHFNDTLGTPSDRFDDETEAEYALPYRVVVPLADASLPLAGRADQSQSSHAWTSVARQHTGKIVFAADFIDASVGSDAAFRSEFAATDRIYGRAWWPHSLNNYALALDADGKPLYGPEFLFDRQHDVELLLFVSVDGRQVKRSGQVGDAFSWFRVGVPAAPERGRRHVPGSEVDFWAYTQTCRLHVGLDEISDPADDWVNVANRFRRLFQTLCNGETPSSHAVRLDLCYRVVTNHNHFEAKPGKALFPLHDTPISAPIASGEFTVKVPARAADIRLAPMFRKRSDKLTIARSLAADYEGQIKDWLNAAPGWGTAAKALEQTIHVTLDSDWYVCNTEYFKITSSSTGKIVLQKEPVRNAVECYAYFYRTVEKGWRKEEVACFNLSAMARESRNPVAAPPFTGVAVGHSYTFDADLLPDDVLAAIKRCPPALRDGLFDLDKLPHLDYASWHGPQAPMFTDASAASSSSS